MAAPSFIFSEEDILIVTNLITALVASLLVALLNIYAAYTSRLGLSVLITRPPLKNLKRLFSPTNKKHTNASPTPTTSRLWSAFATAFGLVLLALNFVIPFIINALAPPALIFVPNSPAVVVDRDAVIGSTDPGYYNMSLPTCASRDFTWGAPTGYSNSLGPTSFIDNGECPDDPKTLFERTLSSRLGYFYLPAEKVGSGRLRGTFTSTLLSSDESTFPFLLGGDEWRYRTYHTVSYSPPNTHHNEVSCETVDRRLLCPVVIPATRSRYLCPVTSADFNCTSIDVSTPSVLAQNNCFRLSSNTSQESLDWGQGVIYAFGPERDYNTGMALVSNTSLSSGVLTYTEHVTVGDPYHTNRLPFYATKFISLRSGESPDGPWRLTLPVERRDVRCKVQRRLIAKETLSGITNIPSALIWWAESTYDATLPVLNPANTANLMTFGRAIRNLVQNEPPSDVAAASSTSSTITAAALKKLNSSNPSGNGGVIRVRAMSPPAWITLLIFVLIALPILVVVPPNLEQLVRGVYSSPSLPDAYRIDLDAELPLERKVELIKSPEDRRVLGRAAIELLVGTFRDVGDARGNVPSWWKQKALAKR
ncbi:hypothetical protein HK102_003448 [Quaeritorhiza haematococci]|nr:hypothetical protein HK102_003448 [Quaeritorhiza haematococci]